MSRIVNRAHSLALVVLLLAVSPVCAGETPGAVHLNQTGFLPQSPKHATVVTDAGEAFDWALKTAGGVIVANGKTTPFGFSEDAGHAVHTIDFSAFDEIGDGFVLTVGAAKSAPFAIASDLYRPLKYDALAFFYHQRSGVEIDADIVGAEWARPAAHAPDMATCYGKKDDRGNLWDACDYTLDVSRGWYDAGDHGKYVVNGGISVWMLLNYYERVKNDPARRGAFEDGAAAIPEAGDSVSDLLNEARWELDFLLAMQVPDGVTMRLPRGDQTCAKKLKFSEVDASGLVHHKMHDENWTPLPTPPHLDKEERYLSYPSAAATLNLAAVAAQCARTFRGVDDDYSAKCLSAAEKAYAAAKKLPDILAYQVTEGGGGAYGDSRLDDEFYWAAAELYAATGDEKYRSDLKSSPHFLAAPKGDASSTNDISWSGVQTLGTLTLLLSPETLSEREDAKARTAIVAAADAYLSQTEKDGYGAPFDRSYNWGSNGDMANRGVVMAYAYDATGEEKYRNGVIAVMDYLLGRNPLGQSYISGYGENPMKAPHHRFWAKAADPALPGPPPGALAGGPNESTAPDPIAKRIHSNCVAQTCYADEIEAYSLNEVAINWNAPFFWIAAFLDEESLTGNEP